MPKRQRDAADDVVQRSFAARPHLPRMDHLTPLGSGLKGVLVSCRTCSCTEEVSFAAVSHLSSV